MERSTGMVLVVVGVGVVLLGVLVMSGAMSWFGRLPGDIRVEGERTRVFVPIVSMLVLSVVLTVVVNVAGRWFR
jgi:uncharacterized membrane protein YidH (DUF202 family)